MRPVISRAVCCRNLGQRSSRSVLVQLQQRANFGFAVPASVSYNNAAHGGNKSGDGGPPLENSEEKICVDSVKKLRGITGSSMGQCRKALQETQGDIDGALEWLKKRNVTAAKTRWENIEGQLPEGLVAMALSEGKGCLVTLGAQTDFVAKNEDFQKTALECASNFLKGEDSQNEALLEQLCGRMGETIRIVDVAMLEGPSITGYVHPSSPEDLPLCGKVGSLVAVESSGGNYEEVGRKLSRHIAAQHPKYRCVSDVSTEVLESEKQIYRAQLDHAGKKVPEDKIEKMLAGKLKKFFSDEVLYEQTFLYDETMTVKEFLDKEAGGASFKDFKMLKTQRC